MNGKLERFVDALIQGAGWVTGIVIALLIVAALGVDLAI